MTRAVYASLHSAGFPPILNRKGSAAEVVDPSDVANVDSYVEERDRLKVNEVILQFMAFSRYLVSLKFSPFVAVSKLLSYVVHLHFIVAF